MLFRSIAIDAFLIRMTLVPAVMTLLGRAAWWMPRWLGRLLPNVDIEGEQLREHRDAVVWAEGQRGLAVSAEELVTGTADSSVGPLSLAIPAGAIAIVSGDPIDRRLVAATLAGRLAATGGRSQVAGHPLPSEAAQVSRLVALADVGGVDPGDSSVTIGELLAERIEMTQPWYRAFTASGRADRWLDRVNAVLAASSTRETVTVRPGSALVELPQLERAVALAALALAERTPVVMLDQLDSFASVEEEGAFVTAIRHLAPATTTVMLGTPQPSRSAVRRDVDDRTVIEIDLYSVSKKGALR